MSTSKDKKDVVVETVESDDEEAGEISVAKSKAKDVIKKAPLGAKKAPPAAKQAPTPTEPHYDDDRSGRQHVMKPVVEDFADEPSSKHLRPQQSGASSRLPPSPDKRSVHFEPRASNTSHMSASHRTLLSLAPDNTERRLPTSQQRAHSQRLRLVSLTLLLLAGVALLGLHQTGVLKGGQEPPPLPPILVQFTYQYEHPDELGFFLNDQQLNARTTTSIDPHNGKTNIHADSMIPNHLHGTVPSQLGLLTELSLLNLYSHDLHGQLPTELGLLTHLTSLDFHYNRLSGRIPSQVGLLTNLQQLHLSSNRLTGPVPTQLGLLTQLTALLLGKNGLAGPIPTQLAHATSLKHVNFETNQLEGAIPSQLGLLTSTTELNLKHNNLSGALPWDLWSMTNLREAFFSQNPHLFGEINEETCFEELYPHLEHLEVNCDHVRCACKCQDWRDDHYGRNGCWKQR